MELNKIYCEDCMETMSRMKDNFIDLTVTSPPYDNLRTYNDNIDETWGEDVWKPIIKELYRVTKEGGVVVWVVGDAIINGSETGVSFQQALWAKECGFNLHDTMFYHKNGMPMRGSLYAYNQTVEYMFVLSKGSPNSVNIIYDRPNKSANKVRVTTNRGKDGKINKQGLCKTKKMGRRECIWSYNTGQDEDNVNHPAKFPEKLSKDHIYSWSNEGDLVYDPFMGSGTTAKMAHLLKRKWIGSELSQEYVDLANKRLDPYLRQTQLF